MGTTVHAVSRDRFRTIKAWRTPDRRTSKAITDLGDIARAVEAHTPSGVLARRRDPRTRIFGRPVDLGVLSTTNVVYAKEAIATGRLLFERDRRVTARFAMLALSMYASLQEARREVLRTYAA